MYLAIKDLRERHGLTQKEFADKVGLSVSTIIKYEKKNCNPNLKNIIKIADAFGISIDSLIRRGVRYRKKEIM